MLRTRARLHQSGCAGHSKTGARARSWPDTSTFTSASPGATTPISRISSMGSAARKLTECSAKNAEANLPASDFDHITISGYHGAMWAAATAEQLTFKFYVVDGEVKKDECVLTKTKDGQKLKCTGASEQKPISDDEGQGEET